MSWSDLVLPSPGKSLAPVTVSCNAAGGRYAQFLQLRVRPDLLDGGLPWWTPKAWVRVQTGSGEHSGRLRIATGENGHFRLRTSGGLGGLAVLVLRGFQPLPTGPQRKVAVEFERGNGWLQVTLPSWAVPAPPPPSTPRATMPALTQAQIDAAVAARRAGGAIASKGARA